MPLIQITTKPKLHPLAVRSRGTADQKITADFARALPGLLVARAKKLHLDPDTPETGAQITHRKFHSQDVNAPDMWVVVQFSESGLSEAKRNKVTGQIKKIVIGWFNDNGYAVPANFACDCFWGPSHGFLSIQGKQLDW